MDSPKNIICIDDEDMIRRVFTSYLKKAGYVIFEAESGQEGIELIKNNDMDLVLLDLRMPGMSGLEVLSYIQENNPNLPVIMISGEGEINDVINALRLGASDYITKPILDMAILDCSIDKSLDQARIVQENLEYKKNLENLVNQRTQELCESMEKLKEANNEAKEANRQISISEKRYKHLIEDSNDIIFTLDENFTFITINNAIATHLNLSPDSVISTDFNHLLYENPDVEAVGKKVVQEKLSSFLKEKRPVHFKAEFKSETMLESIEMAVKLEYINFEGKNEILGKLSRVVDDSLLEFFGFVQQKYIIKNSLILANDVTQRVTRDLQKFADGKEIILLRIALRELIINAIEHGNLEISFDEKTRTTADGTYFDFISDRQKNPKYMNKRVSIEYSIDPGEAVYVITDEGNGFDHQKELNEDNNLRNQKMLLHGRGIKMTKNFFDEIIYNDLGNQVTVKKFFKSE
ncbi:MAG: response regulator [bacterium]|nr:response regulator [bacterium]